MPCSGDGQTAQGAPTSVDPAATDRGQRQPHRRADARQWDDGAEGGRIHVSLPDGIPRLTPRASRTLLDILVQLTTVEVLDARPGGSLDD